MTRALIWATVVLLVTTSVSAGLARRRRRITSAWDCTRISMKRLDLPRARWSSSWWRRKA
jgi:hypothetical protein